MSSFMNIVTASQVCTYVHMYIRPMFSGNTYVCSSISSLQFCHCHDTMSLFMAAHICTFAHAHIIMASVRLHMHTWS